jgi:hypothetical protein
MNQAAIPIKCRAKDPPIWVLVLCGQLAAAIALSGDGCAGLERYDKRFKPETGLGGFEIWILVRI